MSTEYQILNPVFAVDHSFVDIVCYISTPNASAKQITTTNKLVHGEKICRLDFYTKDVAFSVEYVGGI